jgi:DNA-binding beta-propeller fold protein YncE
MNQKIALGLIFVLLTPTLILSDTIAYVGHFEYLNQVTYDLYPNIYVTNIDTGHQVLHEIEGIPKFENLAVSPLDGQIYTIRQGASQGWGYRLYNIDLETDQAELVGSVSTENQTYIPDTAFSIDGSFYAINHIGILLAIDPNNAHYTVIGDLDIESPLGLAINSDNDAVCYGFDGSSQGFCTVDLSTGVRGTMHYFNDFRLFSIEFGPDDELYAWRTWWDNGTHNALYHVDVNDFSVTEVKRFPVGSWAAFTFEIYCPKKPISDLNGDCKVNLLDFYIFASEWLACGCLPAKCCDH